MLEEHALMTPKEFVAAINRHQRFLHKQADGVRADLTGQNLSGLRLPNLNFRDAILTDADFRDAVITGCNFRNAELLWAKFQGADAEETDFGVADLRGTYFKDAKLAGANFKGADLTRLRHRVTDLGPILVGKGPEVTMSKLGTPARPKSNPHRWPTHLCRRSKWRL